MLKLYDHIEVKELKINNSFSPTSAPRTVKYSDDKGIKVDVNLINTFREISKLPEIPSYASYFFEFCQTLNIGHNDKVRWDLVLDKDSNRKYVQMLLDEIRFSLSHLTTYHFYVYPKRLSLYENFVDLVDGEGRDIAKPVYCHNSSTGRTSIKEGFNFLTCSKENRKRVRVKNSTDQVFEIDFKACEPNLYLRSRGLQIDNPDVYSFLASELKLTVEDRATLKRGILSVLYGANNSTSQKLLGGS